MSFNPYEKWYRYYDLSQAWELYRQDKKDGNIFLNVSGFDTESTGLHIKKDKVFLCVLGWMLPEQATGRVFTFYPTQENMKIFFQILERSKYAIAHNVKYDLHVMTNTGFYYTKERLLDSTTLARLGVEALSARHGGDSLRLTDLGSKYVHHEAKKSENLIKEELNKLRNKRVKILTAALKQYPIKGEVTNTGRQKYWSKGAIEAFLKDPTQDVDDLPKNIREIWLEWQREYPEPSYADVPREMMVRYAADDVITMLELTRKLYPVVFEVRQQQRTVEREMRAIFPVYRMERIGLKVDREALKKARERVKAYIKKQRLEMYQLAGSVVNCNQHNRIKKVFKEKYDIVLHSSDKAALTRVKNNYTGKPSRYAELIMELRTLEKWYSTYIVRLLDHTEYDGRFYTQINMSGAISGRVSCDAQQFPRDGIYDEEGNELFTPRKVFIPTGNGYDKLVYIDFSQIELRNQADYTIRVSGGDTNLCRAYMPFKCMSYDFSETYDFNDYEKRKRWELQDYWYTEEGELWTPTDVHSETTHNALLLLGYTCHEPYKHYSIKGTESFYQSVTKDYEKKEKTIIDETLFKQFRNKGKMFNFSKNYGVGLATTMENLEVSEEVAKALIQGYTKSFPHVIAYQEAVSRQHLKQGYVQNMYGRRYYLKDTRQSYRLANYLVQGTCADMMKECIIAIDEYLQKEKAKTRMILTVHDELQFELWTGEEYLIPEIKNIMERHDWHLIPIVAEVEYSSKNWFETTEWKEVN